jgi:hypothetical protein
MEPTLEKRRATSASFKKGEVKPGQNTKGKPKGAINKVSRSVKEALTEAFDKMGGVPSLVKWGRLNQTDFYKLWTRLLPIQITGNDGGAIVVETKYDLSKFSIDELTTLANLVDKASIARAAAGETVAGGVAVRLPKSALER